MVIAKKPEKSIDNKLIDQILVKGGSVAQSKINPEEREEAENIKITIRIPKKMLHTIDSFLKTSIYSKPRSVWIKEAIEQKIETDILERN